MKRIAIIGGGISGLSAAFYLEQHRREGAQFEYVLLERSQRFGGVLLTENVDGCLVEAGPDSFLTEKPWAANLCQKLSIADQLIGSNDSQRKTYIVSKRRLVPLPEGLMFMAPTKILPTLLSPLFSFRTKFRIGQEWFQHPRAALQDESVADFVERHYGREVVERIADPLLSGVYGATANQLSVRATLPRFAAIEAKYGSLGRAMLASRRQAEHSPMLSRSIFTSLRRGMQQMADVLVALLPPECLRAGITIRKLTRQSDSWLLWLQEGTLERFDSLILAIPAPAAGTLLEPVDAALASELRQFAYTSSITVTLGYQRDSIKLPPGFGFLVPRTEGKNILACTFVHNKFPHRAPADRGLLRCFFGGERAEQLFSSSDEQLAVLARRELLEILNLTTTPLFARVFRWRQAMPQYAVGHLERLERIERRRKELPDLYLAGNAYQGIGVPDCIRSGMEAARHAAGVDKTVTQVTSVS